MIVVPELDARFLAGLTGAVEQIHGALPSAGLHALLFVNPRTDDVAVADDFRGFQSFRPLFFDDVVADVAGRGGQAILVEDLANVLRRMIEVAGKFHFLVADGGDFRDGACEVRFHGVANGVELDADAIDFVRGVHGPGWAQSGQGCCDGGADKCASIHAPHFTLSAGKGNRDSVPEAGRRSISAARFVLGKTFGEARTGTSGRTATSGRDVRPKDAGTNRPRSRCPRRSTACD